MPSKVNFNLDPTIFIRAWYYDEPPVPLPSLWIRNRIWMACNLPRQWHQPMRNSRRTELLERSIQLSDMPKIKVPTRMATHSPSIMPK